MSYQIFTDATADLTPELLEGLPQVSVLPMDLIIGGQEATYGPGGTITVKAFYGAQRSGQFAATSQIRPALYLECFADCLRRGEDVLYLCFSSGMSGTFQSACLCAEELRELWPQRRIVCIDTLCASVGEGFLVREAARKQAEGFTMDALADWVEEYKLRVCHWFTVDTFEHLRHGGRVSAAAAAMGTLVQIKPLLHVSELGGLEVAEKPRGNKNAMAAQLARMRKGWTPEISPLVIVGHGDCPDRAAALAAAVREEFPIAEIFTAPIGPIIGAHTGPGMLALIFWGTER